MRLGVSRPLSFTAASALQTGETETQPAGRITEPLSNERQGDETNCPLLPLQTQGPDSSHWPLRMLASSSPPPPPEYRQVR